jgi:hypothetical protein
MFGPLFQGRAHLIARADLQRLRSRTPVTPELLQLLNFL